MPEPEGGVPGRARLATAGDPATEAPVAFAVITWTFREFSTGRSETGEVRASRDGLFEIPVRRDGILQIRGRAEGLLAEPHPGFDTRSPSGPLTLWFHEPRSIRGRVVGQDGEPIAGARVEHTLDRVAGAAPWRRSDASGGKVEGIAETGPDGSFRLEGLIPGEHLLTARARGYRTFVRRADTGAGAVELVLRPLTGLVVRVRTRSGDPVPLRGLWIEVSPRGGEGAPQISELKVDESDLELGEAVVSIRDARPIRLVAVPREHPPVRSDEILRPDGPAIELITEEGHAVRGRLESEQGLPVVGGVIRPLDQDLGLSRYSSAESRSDGGFVLVSDRQLNGIEVTADGYLPTRVKPPDPSGAEGSRQRDIGAVRLAVAGVVEAVGPAPDISYAGLFAELDPAQGAVADPRKRLDGDAVTWSSVPGPSAEVRWLARSRDGRRFSEVRPAETLVFEGAFGVRAEGPVRVGWPESAFGRVRLRVLVDGRPQPSFEVQAEHELLQLSATGRTEAGGVVTMPMPEGPVRIGWGDGGLGPMRFGPVVEVLDGQEVELSLDLRPFRIEARLVDEADGTFIHQATVEVVRTDEEGRSTVVARARSNRDGFVAIGPMLLPEAEFGMPSLRITTPIHEALELSDVLAFGPEGSAALGDVYLRRGCELALLLVTEADLPEGTMLRAEVGGKRIEQAVTRTELEVFGLPAGTCTLTLVAPDGTEISSRTTELDPDNPRLIRWRF